MVLGPEVPDHGALVEVVVKAKGTLHHTVGEGFAVETADREWVSIPRGRDIKTMFHVLMPLWTVDDVLLVKTSGACHCVKIIQISATGKRGAYCLMCEFTHPYEWLESAWDQGTVHVLRRDGVCEL